jgi:hypothetical protein
MKNRKLMKFVKKFSHLIGKKQRVKLFQNSEIAMYIQIMVCIIPSIGHGLRKE